MARFTKVQEIVANEVFLSVLETQPNSLLAGKIKDNCLLDELEVDPVYEEYKQLFLFVAKKRGLSLTPEQLSDCVSALKMT